MCVKYNIAGREERTGPWRAPRALRAPRPNQLVWICRPQGGSARRPVPTPAVCWAWATCTVYFSSFLSGGFSWTLKSAGQKACHVKQALKGTTELTVKAGGSTPWPWPPALLPPQSGRHRIRGLPCEGVPWGRMTWSLWSGLKIVVSCRMLLLDWLSHCLSRNCFGSERRQSKYPRTTQMNPYSPGERGS